ncbi:sodium/hydrogen exchanger 9B2-like [Schistocerca serialis cubense]|uniref:sodium/hydrogen exchanger 9B2-like n=1 Tax=Schistocerca serialis cubense TaxID=2023355 RepID=UPI00214F08FF|nr:sodium/hydrogen exchanger 9B2-like [Schistocerca serialis cubense]
MIAAYKNSVLEAHEPPSDCRRQPRGSIQEPPLPPPPTEDPPRRWRWFPLHAATLPSQSQSCHNTPARTLPQCCQQAWAGRPSYRQVARFFALFVLTVLAWAIAYSIAGPHAAPGGQLFGLAVLVLGAHLGGQLAALLRLPSLLGMMLVGMALQNLHLIDLGGSYTYVCAVLRHLALVMILVRAGLDLEAPALRRLAPHVVKLAALPWAVECTAVAATTHFLLGLPWMWGFLVGSAVSAVAPAVVVPSLLRLRARGYGAAKAIPTLIIAVSAIDDGASVAIFGVILSVIFSEGGLAFRITQGPASILGGVGFGVLWGLLARWVPEKDDPLVVPLRVLLLLCGGVAAVFGSEALGVPGAGSLGCLTAAFVSGISWEALGTRPEDNPVATAFEIFWIIFEPALFGITGTQIKFEELTGNLVSLCVACIITAMVVRILATMLLGIGSKLNLKEKIFVSLSWMAKAAGQAALCSQALLKAKGPGGSEEEVRYGKLTELLCVLSIVIAAPLCAISIIVSGPHLLKKMDTPPPETWSKSARPSIMIMSIAESEEAPRPETWSKSARPSIMIVPIAENEEEQQGEGKVRKRVSIDNNATSVT